MRPSRPDLTARSENELGLIVSSSEYIPEVRVDARDLMLRRGADPGEVARLFALGGEIFKIYVERTHGRRYPSASPVFAAIFR